MACGQIERAKKMAAVFFRKYHGRYLFDDLLSGAYFGLVEAAQRYREEKGAFSAFAYFYIVKHIRLVHIETQRANGWVYANQGRSLRQFICRAEWPSDSNGHPLNVIDGCLVS